LVKHQHNCKNAIVELLKFHWGTAQMLYTTVSKESG